MLIRKIEIENVKTHKNTSITFKEGLNVLYGDNGAGKSTVLEMIGFILFDFLKSKTQHADYIRSVENERPSYGIVKIWISGSDNKIYRILRTIGRSDIEVTHHNGKLLSPEINTISKFRSWIKKQIGVKYDVNLETLFNTAIGIPQGMIINSFLMSPKERKEYFDEIFQLDIYEKFWENLGKIERNYKDELIELQNRISRLIGETNEKQEKQKIKQNLIEKLQNKKNKLEECKKNKKSLQIKLEKLKTLKKKLENITIESKQLDLEKKNEEENLNILQQQLNESIKAEKVCNKTKNAYEKFSSLSKIKNNLINQNENLNKQKEELNKLNQNYQKINSKYTNLEEKIKDAQFSKEKLKEILPKYQEFLTFESKLQKINEELAIIDSNEDILEKNKNKLSKFNKELISLRNVISKLPDLQKEYETIINFEKIKDSLQLEISSIENDLSFFKNNQNKIENKLCPFSGQKCTDMLEGNFNTDFFKKEINSKQKKLGLKKNKLNEIKEKLSNKSKIQIKLESLKKDSVKIEEYERQKKDLNDEITQTERKISQKEDFIDSKNKIKEKIEKLKIYYDEYLIHKKTAQNLQELQKKLSPLNTKLKKLEQKRKTIKKEINKKQDIPSELAAVRQELNELENDYNNYQKNINEAEKLVKRKKKMTESEQNLENLKNLYQQKLKEKKKHEKKFDEDYFNKLKKELDENNEICIKLKENMRNIQEQIDQINESLEKLEKKELKLEKLQNKELNLKAERKFVNKIRIWIREFKPKMRRELIKKVNRYASNIYRNIRGDQNTSLQWDKNYEIEIIKAKTKQRFLRLSGGEKMSAALAVRLAILKTLTSAKFAIFDEPTINLDETSKNNLSKYINNIEGFNQLFVISHDDSFKRHSEYVIKFTKDDNEQTKINYLTKIS